VKADVAGPALTEFLKEFGRLRGGDVSDAEAAKAVRTVRTEAVQALSGVHGPVGAAAGLLTVGLGYETLGQDLEAARRVTAAELNEAAKTALATEPAVLVLVGDKRLILEQLKSVPGLPEPVESTPEGEIAGGH
jgi:predicted Zn-dependent peptidase